MKDFGEWFANPARRAPERAAEPQAAGGLLAARQALEDAMPDGMGARYFVDCCICERRYEWPVEPELYEAGINNYCGGGPRCCP